MGLNRKMALLAVAVVITAIAVSALTTSLMFKVATNARSERMTVYNGRYPDKSWPMLNQPRRGMTLPVHRGFSAPSHWMQSKRPSTTLTVTGEQAKTIVSDAVKAFKVGEAKDTGNVWMVSIKYKDNVVMTVLLGKLNTPTSGDAVKAVQDSIGKGWRAGEPRLLGLTYNVPIIDASGNAIGNIRVDGGTGNITAEFSPLRR